MDSPPTGVVSEQHRRPGFRPSFSARWLVYEELRIFKTFRTGLTISLRFTYQNVFPWLADGCICWADYSISGTCFIHIGSISHHSNNFSLSLCILVLSFTANAFDQGAHKPLSSQDWQPAESIVAKCLISNKKIFLLTWWSSSHTCCYCFNILCCLELGGLYLLLLTYIVMSNSCVLIFTLLLCITLPM